MLILKINPVFSDGFIFARKIVKCFPYKAKFDG